MKYIKYSPHNIREIKPNICMNMICGLEQRKKCEKEKVCSIQMCSNDERMLTKISPYKDLDESDDKKIARAIKRFRKNMFNKCKMIVYTIELKDKTPKPKEKER